MSAVKVEIKLFTVKDLKAWLYENKIVTGLTSKVISKCRADAIIHNPYVNDDDPVVVAIYDSGQLAAYTASFPDMINGERVWWFSSLWCHESFQGQGYPLIAIGSLCEARSCEPFFDMWGAEETVMIFNYLGLKCDYFEEYILSKRYYSVNGLKNRLLSFYVQIKDRKKRKQSVTMRKISSLNYVLEYVHFIDEEIYSFIIEHSQKDLLKRSKEMLNWILAYSFLQQAPLTDRVDNSCYFFDNSIKYWRTGVKVIENEELVGFYIIRESSDELSLKYLYYCESEKELVFSSVMEHIIKLGKQQFLTRNKDLRNFVAQTGYYDKSIVSNVSFSHPENFKILSNIESQGGDGDGFA